MKTPLETLYVLKGHTEPQNNLPQDAGALSLTTPCSHCKQNPGTVPTKSILSHNFTQWDTLQENIMPSLCSACAWSYSDPKAKRYRLLITPTEYLPLPSNRALQLLKETPEKVAVIFAIQGQKQLLPHLLTWGTATTDTRTFRWNSEHNELIDVIKHLKTLGVNEKELLLENPPPKYPLSVFYRTWLRYSELRNQHSDLLTLAVWLSRDE